MNRSNYPFQPLGKQLRQLREKKKETLAEVSGAVEIEPEILNAIEDGVRRPSEDILMLLISHFAAKEEVANKLWTLAGYNADNMSEIGPKSFKSDLHDKDKHTIVAMPGDLRIVYTDMVHVMANDFGIVMNFMQTAGLGGHPLAIARVGMSREHAQSVLELLQKTLAASAQKSLPAPSQQLPEDKDGKTKS
jgi:transcriptional regulator with XRE-family HTH domain